VFKFISRGFHLKQCKGFSEGNKEKCVEEQNKFRYEKEWKFMRWSVGSVWLELKFYVCYF
jgi:hypothetical protein